MPTLAVIPALQGITAPEPPRRSATKTLVVLGAWLAFAVIMGWAWWMTDIRPLELWRDRGNMFDFIIGTVGVDGSRSGGFFPADFGYWRLYANGMLETVAMALWGSLLAVLCAIPFGLLCAANVAPWWIHQPMRRLMDCSRAINELVFALMFVAAVGLGPMAGILALWIHTTGILAKLFSEAVESIDPRPVEGIRATGANVVSEVLFGVIPQVVPLWISYALYRFESNVRAATVVGLVGAGGIGMVLHESMRSFNYQSTCAILVIIVAVVVALDVLSAQTRKLFI